jgi:prepilin-type N-terminal cleavage/methylation domain-containing protein/prepilin-type processing-associated H-X9-DG protein
MNRSDRARRRSPRLRGFTLIELLVVIAIIAVMMALLVPAVQKVREANNRMVCAHKLKQIGIALHNYESDFKRFPVGGVTEGPCCGNRSRTNWAIEILPYLEQNDLFKQFQDRVGNIPPGLSGGPGIYNESSQNNFARRQRVIPYECPSDIFDERDYINRPASGPGNDLNLRFARGSYRAVSGRSGGNGRVFWDTCEPGLGTLNPLWRGLLHSVGASACPQGNPERFASMLDGTSNTIIVGEYTNWDVPRRRTFWSYTYTSYNQSSITPFTGMINNSYNDCAQKMVAIGLTDNICKRGFGSFHADGGLNFLLGDGHVKYVSKDVDINMLAAMATVAGGETMNIIDNSQ